MTLIFYCTFKSYHSYFISIFVSIYFFLQLSEEQGVKRNPHHDPIHNQEWYLDEKMRNRLFKEYGVEAYSIAQCYGDAIFIPAGSPHQVI